MNRILLLDCETTGLGPEAVAIEVAVILYSVEHACPLRSYASLIRADANPAEDVNRIPAAVLADAPEAAAVWAGVAKFAALADAIIAHNADFDRRFVPEFATCGKPWICSMGDLDWPLSDPGQSLVSVALDHGVGVASAHRAMADCDLLARTLTRVAWASTGVLASFLARGLRPKARFVALVPFERKDEARAAGFKWDQPEAPRAWSRNMAIEDVGGLPFETRRVG